MSKKFKYQPIRDYINAEDLLIKAGHKQYVSKLGSLGRAIIEASKHHRSVGWLKGQLDVFFKGVRANYKGKRKKNESRI